MSVLAAGVRQHPTVQVATAAAWSCLCIFMVVQLSRSLDKQHIQLLWTYFQPIGPPLLLLWLWSITVAHFEKQQIPFDVCFPEKERKLLAASKDLFAAARAYSCAVVGGLALCAWLCTTGSSLTPLLVPPVLYGTMAALTVMPVDVLRLQSRRFFVRTLCKVLVPVQQVGWADFLLADMLTSLAKSSSDMSRSMCLMVHGPLMHPAHPSSAAAAAACGPLTTLSLAALVLPYFVRMLQGISVWRSGGPRSQLFNALKYASSLPALMLTAIEHEYHVHKQPFPWKRAWIICMMLNSSYSYYWDVEQDWNMPWIVDYGSRKAGPIPLPSLKGDHLYSRSWYTWLLLSNLVLRFTWAHRLLGDLEAHNEVLMIVALLEVVRRWQWVYVRLETELRKLGMLDASLGHTHSLHKVDHEAALEPSGSDSER
eukprot:GHUV01017054.1.p1 GENE.GHUV01017054.1~~GHUV01017054.1.p1  ORF type:complete len:425 (+),score=75.63 GHUV01017054.1:708-1982(+)